MRIGDFNKIKGHVKNGKKDSEIIPAFINEYPEEELKRFLREIRGVKKPAEKAKSADKK